MKDILSFSQNELIEEFAALSLPSYRAKQAYREIHKNGALSFSDITTLPLALRQELKEKYAVCPLEIKETFISRLDGTRKYLFALSDGDFIESVVMKYKYGYSICVSSQVGCKMGCAFCASTLAGFKRNLTPGEILAQVYLAQKDLGQRISHIVMMGIGEPLDNFESVTKFIQIVTDENGNNLSGRNISLSTCGIVPKIYELMEKKLALTLSVSLHAPNDEIRNKIMPVSKRYSMQALLSACREYTNNTGRRISFEYSMIKGVNDSAENANELGKKLKGMLCHVNLIPINEVKESPYKPSDKKQIENFVKILSSYGITATVRRKLGADINASCGQLRRSRLGSSD